MTKRSVRPLNMGRLPQHVSVARECNFEGCHEERLDKLQLDICAMHLTKMITDLRGVASRAPDSHADAKSPMDHAALAIKVLFQPVPDSARRSVSRSGLWPAGPVVYYVRLGGHIKIGYSGNFTKRLTALTAYHADWDVLALETDGTYELESERHAKFAHLRLNRTEMFRPSDELMDHINSVRVAHGQEPMDFTIAA